MRRREVDRYRLRFIVAVHNFRPRTSTAVAAEAKAAEAVSKCQHRARIIEDLLGRETKGSEKCTLAVRSASFSHLPARVVLAAMLARVVHRIGNQQALNAQP